MGIALLVLAGPTGDFLVGWAKAGTPCRVVALIDGDTVRLSCPERDMPNGRLIGFDTPELFSPKCPRELLSAIGATFALRWQLWRAGEISVVMEGRDRYDRALVRLRLDGTSVARPMIDSGWARSYDGGRRRSWCGAA